MNSMQRHWTIGSEEELRAIIAPPMNAITKGTSERIGLGAQRLFAAHSTFVCITTRRTDGWPEVSPLGGAPGLLAVLSEKTLLVALDGPLDGSAGILHNLAANPFCGLLIMIPGVDNTMRVNGTASVVDDPAQLAAAFGHRGAPAAAVQLEIGSVRMHCPKVFVRSRLWDALADLTRSWSGDAAEGAVLSLTHLDQSCREFIARSPFLVLGSSLLGSGATASPRGDPAGFVRVLDDRTVVVPDRPGNRLADNFSNVLSNPRAALLFLIPGSEQALRLRGGASLSTDPELLEPLSVQGKRPSVGLLLDVHAAELDHSGALARARLWDPAARAEQASLPSIGEVAVDQLQPGGRFQGVKGKVADAVMGKMFAWDTKKNLY